MIRLVKDSRRKIHQAEKRETRMAVLAQQISLRSRTEHCEVNADVSIQFPIP